MEKEKKQTIDLSAVFARIWASRKTFYYVIPTVLVLSALYIFPQPRYYKAEVSLAPETGGTEVMGGIASIASSFGINLGSLASNDAIYPLLYPALFESPEFLVSLFDIQIRTADGEVECDYYTYLKTYQKKNPYVKPFKATVNWIKGLFVSPTKSIFSDDDGINAFSLSEKDYDLMLSMQDDIICTNDKQTDVTTITVEAQDPLVCALLADSISVRLQNFLTQYRTSKARMDLEFYQQLCDSSMVEYEAAARRYSEYCDANRNGVLQSVLTMKDQLQEDLTLKQNTYQTYLTQVQAMKSKVQERTPAFTTLRSATVPIKPAGPKRILFMLGMCVFAGLAVSVYKVRDLLF